MLRIYGNVLGILGESVGGQMQIERQACLSDGPHKVEIS
jgi:hypothetical protein